MAKKIYVGNMNYATTEDELSALFSQYGDVTSVNIIKDKYTGQAKGFGFVEMAQDDAAVAAISALDGKDFGGRKLRVNEAENRPRRDRDNYRY
jgi:RNA recognition motif-containing protein